MSVKLIIETGGESHTSSSASLQAKFIGGPYAGQYLHQQRQFQRRVQWDNALNSQWVTTHYELPEGTEIEIEGKGRSGNRGVNQHCVHRIYRLDPDAEVLEENLSLGIRQPLLKGRLTLVRNVAKEERQAQVIDLEEGF